MCRYARDFSPCFFMKFFILLVTLQKGGFSLCVTNIRLMTFSLLAHLFYHCCHSFLIIVEDVIYIKPFYGFS